MRIELVLRRRQITNDDLRAINGLIQQLSTNAKEMTRQRIARVIQKAYLIVARDDAGGIVGMTVIVIHDHMVRTEAWLEDVVVDRDARQQGLGEALVIHADKLARDCGADRVLLTCQPERVEAHRLYERLGFQRYDTDVYRLMLPPPTIPTIQ